MSESHERLASFSAPSFTSLPAYVQGLLAIVASFLPTILAAARPAIVQFLKAHLSLSEAQELAEIGKEVVAAKGG